MHGPDCKKLSNIRIKVAFFHTGDIYVLVDSCVSERLPQALAVWGDWQLRCVWGAYIDVIGVKGRDALQLMAWDLMAWSPWANSDSL